MRILVAGVGNVLRTDDGFGVEVAQRLAEVDLPNDTRVVETGIGGMTLVHELQDGWDILIVVDTVARDRPPGTLMVIDPEVVDVECLDPMERHDLLADMHLTTPDRALMLAKALGVLPPHVLEVGCQPEDAQAVGEGLSVPVTAAVEVAVTEILRHVDEITSGQVPAA